MTKKTAAKNVTVSDVKKQFEKEIEKGLKTVEKEAAKIRKQADAAVKQADAYIRKNPEKAMAIASGISAALGAAVALIASHGKKGKKK
ncbi:MAG: hypothetical protein WCJ25_05415 [Candidatus Moraniibacteriota bacterium]